MTGAVAIFLARYNPGVDHYNALVPDHKNHEGVRTSSSTNTSMMTSEKLQKKKIMAQNPQRNTGKRFSRSKVKHFLSAKKEIINKGPLDVAEHYIFLSRTVVNNLFPGKDPHLMDYVVYHYNYAVQVVCSDKCCLKYLYHPMTIQSYFVAIHNTLVKNKVSFDQIF